MPPTTSIQDTLLSSLTPSKSSKYQWNFVNISTPSQKKDAAIRKLVRGQAMRDFRRRQRQEQILSRGAVKLKQVKELEPESSYADPVVQPTSYGEDQEQEAELAPADMFIPTIEPVANPQTLLDACTSDPFHVYPACNGPRGHRLLSHCKYLFILNRFLMLSLQIAIS